MPDCSAQTERLKSALDRADAVVIGAGAGLSTAAGYTYAGARFEMYFADFAQKYGIRDMYAGGFYPFPTQEEFWAYWSRYIFINRYQDAPKPVYEGLRKLVAGKDYFVVTTNVDHCFQKAGFEKKRLFYTQGDYGLFQCSGPCHFKTYDNEPIIRKMIAAQGYGEKVDGTMALPEGNQAKMAVPTELLPHCPRCGRPMTMNLRADDTFVEDEGWHAAAERYENFLHTRAGQKVLFLELGVGYSTPGIIKYPFWRMTDRNPNATYACLNYGEAVCPREIERQAICIEGDIGACLLAVEEGDRA